MVRKKELKRKLREQEAVIEMISNEEAIKGLKSALEDVKQGRYITLTN